MSPNCLNRFFKMSSVAKGTVLVSLCMASLPALAAEPKRCDWHGELSGGEKPYSKCIDFATLEGKTLGIPKNVTRISADGISFCQPKTPVTGAGNADIVFIYDNSGSMTPDGIYVEPIQNDTNFYFYVDNDSVCAKNAKLNRLVNIPSQETGTRSVFLLDSNSGCQSQVAGDPYTARGTVIRSALDFLAVTSPTSTAGAISFNHVVNYEQKPVLMNTAGRDLVKRSIKLDDSGKTLYRPPLEKALSWLTDPNLIKTNKQAIIFISDGAPNKYDYTSLFDSLPPVFSIYLSNVDTPDMAKLQELSEKTGGTFNRVSTKDPKAMEQILRNIISTITKNTMPKTVTVTNTSLSPPQTSKGTSIAVQADGGAGIVLDSIIALDSGLNKIQINVTREDNTSSTYSFTMDVSKAAISSTSGNYSCWDMPTMVAVDKANLPTEIYRRDNDTYTLKLTRSPSELSSVNVNAISANNDKEVIALPTINNSLGFPTQTGDFKYNPAQANPSEYNGVLEVDGRADLTFTWSHPRDAREFVSYVLPGVVTIVLDGNVGFEIKDPITKGQTFDLVRFKDRDPVVITEATGKCVINCSGTESFHNSTAVPTWNLVVKSPIKYSIRMFDNLGQFVSESDGELNTSAWASLAKTGDSAVVHLKILPVSKQGQQIGTGAYVLMATITALGAPTTTGSNGEPIRVKAAKREYLKRFGYMRK